MFNLGSCLYLAAMLFAIGTWGVIARRNLLVVLMSIEVMLNAVNLAMLAFGRWWGGLNGQRGQVFVLMIMAVAAAEAAVGLAILLTMFRNRATVDADEMDVLKH